MWCILCVFVYVRLVCVSYFPPRRVYTPAPVSTSGGAQQTVATLQAELKNKEQTIVTLKAILDKGKDKDMELAALKRQLQEEVRIPKVSVYMHVWCVCVCVC